jgi:hypothetical protein
MPQRFGNRPPVFGGVAVLIYIVRDHFGEVHFWSFGTAGKSAAPEECSELPAAWDAFEKLQPQWPTKVLFFRGINEVLR